MSVNSKSSIRAEKLRIKGTVQGVGFRPFVFVLAKSEGLTGTVLNDGRGVEAVVEGPSEALERFRTRLLKELPPLASIESVEAEDIPVEGRQDFVILESRSNSVSTVIPADAAVCEACLKELTDKNNRRYRYPFINCTHCGPRYTITAHLPYDRPQTSMKVFPMCPDCLQEYKDPLDRRFHAQPNACDVCGPHVELKDKTGAPVPCEDEIAELLRQIQGGKIAAVKGLGGFHLVCDAANAVAVSELRRRKHRPFKPFAVMALNDLSASRFVRISEKASKELHSPQAPIVLCPKTNDADLLLPGIAPELNRIGIMMPYTPIHWLLFFEAMGRPEDPDWYKKECDLVLVMTSANAGGEPLVIDNDEAVQKLDGIADLFLTHNRDILIRCDDSVMQQRDQDVQLIRRARGFTPVAVRLPYGGPSVIATGPWLKNTACLTKGDHAFLTQHIGDTDRVSNCRTLARAVEHLSEIFEITPKYIACDLHPDFYSTSLAEELADKYDAELVPVQHHHAHIAAVMAEHGLSEPVLGLALDGVGLGTDNKPWGGELLKVTPEGFERLSSIAPIKMPGADKCAREGWRMAAKIFAENGKTDALEKLAQDVNKPSLRLIAAQANAPETTSLGRLFDAAASMFGICHISSYEGEAPVRLQAASEGRRGQNRADLVEVISGHPNFVPLLLALSEYADKRQAAADFQETLAQVLAKEVITVSEKEQIRKVCLSGGCCLNSLLTQRLRELLEQQELQVYEGLKVPPNDGGVSLGQAWVVLMRLHSTAKE